LHETIGRTLAAKPKLSGKELRYLCKSLGFSQVAFSPKYPKRRFLCGSAKAASPYATARFTQALYLEVVDGGLKLHELVETLAQLDDKQTERLGLKETPAQG